MHDARGPRAVSGACLLCPARRIQATRGLNQAHGCSAQGTAEGCATILPHS